MSSTFQETMARLRSQGTDDALVEVKSSAKKLGSSVWDSVSAFANTAGGLIILGLSEEAGFEPVEGFDVDAVRDQFVAGVGDAGDQGVRLTNPPAYGIVREFVGESPVLAITIAPNPPGSRPCFITARGLQGGAYKRVDDKDIKLAATEIFAMQHEITVSDADGQIVAEADESDLNKEVLDALIARRTSSKALYGAKTRREQLTRLNVVDKQGGIRLAGLLATGVYPQQFYPRLMIDVAVHPGNEKSLPDEPMRFIDRAECLGRLADVVDEAVGVVVKNLRTHSIVDGTTRREVPEIPVKVLREAIANAVLHREYSAMFLGQPVTVDVFADRVEIRNPGGLWGGVTLDNLGDGTSRCRNQKLLPLMQHVSPSEQDGFTVEGQGGGVRLMKTEMAAHALAEPNFSVGADQVKVTLFRHGAEIPEHREWLRGITDESLTSHEDAALLIARSEGSVSAGQLRSRLRVDSGDAKQILVMLRDEGLLRGVGGDEYVLADQAPVLDEIDEDIVRALGGKDPQSVHEIVESTGLSLGTARARLRRLVDSGAVQATAPPQSRHRKYVARSSEAPNE